MGGGRPCSTSESTSQLRRGGVCPPTHPKHTSAVLSWLPMTPVLAAAGSDGGSSVAARPVVAIRGRWQRYDTHDILNMIPPVMFKIIQKTKGGMTYCCLIVVWTCMHASQTHNLSRLVIDREKPNRLSQ
jgi:hypothetical protein